MTSAAGCVAGDELGNLITYNGTAWGPPVQVFTADEGGVASVSCVGSTFCMPVGAPEQDGGVVAPVEAGEELGARLEQRAVLLAELAGECQRLVVPGTGLVIVPQVRGDPSEVSDRYALGPAPPRAGPAEPDGDERWRSRWRDWSAA